MKIHIKRWAVFLNTEERRPGDTILQSDKLPYLVRNPEEMQKSMNFDVNNNELLSDTAFGCINDCTNSPAPVLNPDSGPEEIGLLSKATINMLNVLFRNCLTVLLCYH